MQYNKNNNFYLQLQNDDKNLVSKVLDMLELCEDKCYTKFSFFLDERQCNLVEGLLKSVKFNNYLLFGGYETSKRKVLGIFPEHKVPDQQEFPIVSIKISYRKQDILSHRDFLGSIMSKQISREIVGDIIVDEGSSVAFIYNTVSELLVNEISKIGSVGVKLSIATQNDFVITDKFEEIIGTIPSLRVDCILSLVTKLSREKIVLLIKSIGVDINYIKIYSPSAIIKPNDVFSLRGYGKFIFSEVGGISKKGRTYVKIKKYI